MRAAGAAGCGGYPVRRLASLPMSEIVEGLGAEERERIARPALRRALLLDRRLRRRALGARRSARHSTSPRTPSARCSTFGHVGQPGRGSSTPTPSTSSSPSTATSSPTARRGDDEEARLEAIEVNVLVHGDYILTVHREPVSLPELLPELQPRGAQRAVRRLRRPRRDGRDRLRRPQRDRAGARGPAGAGRRHRQRAGASRDAAGDQPAADEDAPPARAAAGEVRADRRGDRPGRETWSPTTSATSNAIYEQLNRLIDGIDAGRRLDGAGDGPADERDDLLADGRRDDLPAADLPDRLLRDELRLDDRRDRHARPPSCCSGSAARSSATALTWLAIRRRGTPVQPDQDALERLVTTLRRPLRLRPRPAPDATDGTRPAGERCTAVQRHRTALCH